MLDGFVCTLLCSCSCWSDSALVLLVTILSEAGALFYHCSLHLILLLRNSHCVAATGRSRQKQIRHVHLTPCLACDLHLVLVAPGPQQQPALTQTMVQPMQAVSYATKMLRTCSIISNCILSGNLSKAQQLLERTTLQWSLQGSTGLDPPRCSLLLPVSVCFFEFYL